LLSDRRHRQSDLEVRRSSRKSTPRSATLKEQVAIWQVCE
jgi:hypothetical protein